MRRLAETMFYLMHGTDEVAILSIDPISGAVLKVGHVVRHLMSLLVVLLLHCRAI